MTFTMMSLTDLYYDVTNPITMTSTMMPLTPLIISLPLYYDVTNSTAMTSLKLSTIMSLFSVLPAMPLYYSVTNPLTRHH